MMLLIEVSNPNSRTKSYITCILWKKSGYKLQDSSLTSSITSNKSHFLASFYIHSKMLK